VKVEWSDKALARVGAIVDCIAADDPEAALRWVNKLFSAVESLADFPKRGRAVPEFHDSSVREILIGTYRVIYELGVNLQIITVRHCSQSSPEHDV
jgi:plasmid stabilization system protein ParE